MFTTSLSNTSLDVPVIPVNATSLKVSTRPALKYFRDAPTPSALSSFCSQQSPILFIHVSTLANCACIRISVPHGVFDAVGMGQVVAGLDAELNSKEWVPPRFSSKDVLRQKMDELHTVGPIQEEPIALRHIKLEHPRLGAVTMVKFAFSQAREY
jgi:hypothetical protein